MKSSPEKLGYRDDSDHLRHAVRRIDSVLTDLGHEHRLVIVSSLHLHLDDENCLNIIVVRGKVKDITALEQSVRKVTGVPAAQFRVSRYQEMKYMGISAKKHFVEKSSSATD